jgi:hypothetical protein
MIRFYADAKKYLLHTKNPIVNCRTDKAANQLVHVTGTVFGTTIRPAIRWTTFCEKLFRDFDAKAVWLDDISFAPGGSLDFIARLPACKRLTINEGQKVDLSPLAGIRHLEDVHLGPSTRALTFDLGTLPNLRRCQIPICPELMSVLNCCELVCLYLNGGQHSGILQLNCLPSLKEFICVDVAKLKGVALHPQVRLRSLELCHLKELTSIEPQTAITQELRVVELNKLPRFSITWLKQAEKLECVALRLGEIPTISFLQGLQRLQVLDLFGSKVKDRDFSFRDSLKGELDRRFWSE